MGPADRRSPVVTGGADGVERVLRRIFQSGHFRAFPAHRRDLDVLLAVAASTLTRRRPYAEPEINAALLDWLGSIRAGMDHVTLRRRMVDLDFLKRTVNGSRYFLNYGRVAEVLGDPAVAIDAGAIMADILRDRQARKRIYGSTP